MTIYIPRSPSKVEQNATHELALYLWKTCGYEFPVLPEEDGACGIYVGFTERTEKPCSAREESARTGPR